MQVFVSWSGDRSRLIAEALRAWLPKVVQSLKPWMSAEDIGAGARWLTEVSATLNSATIGIICVTPENQNNPWLLFEAGALSKTLDQTCVCPLLLEMSPGQLNGPLTQFQAQTLNREGVGKVLATVNKWLGEGRIDAQQLEEIVDVWWPKLAEKISALPPASSPVATRTPGDQLEEILSLTRENLRRENLRLESSMERDQKLDAMLNFVDYAQSIMAASQGGIMKMASLVSKKVGSEPSEQTNEMNESVVAMMRALPDSSAIGNMAQFTAGLRELQDRDKARVESMLAARVLNPSEAAKGAANPGDQAKARSPGDSPE
ncbi:toll/interleukin-1 receptor domain-containing protein [Mitsuaria sp. CC2]|uniref:toll/interleukin-1 receptor domain-containing protein n=1 Tax=Mitsuaria sp. CC2 TaxID=3029186 RepID=UPI003B8BEAE9